MFDMIEKAVVQQKRMAFWIVGAGVVYSSFPSVFSSFLK
jgi:hypothetical protein